MEVDPPSSNNISTPIHPHGLHNSYNSRDLESSMNGNGIPAPGSLKRSTSAPSINVFIPSASIELSPPCLLQPIDSQRSRRFSSSSMVHASTTPVKVADRLNQLKQEESHIAVKDIIREREVQSQLQISTSWTDFSLGDHHHQHEPMIDENTPRRPRSFSESLHIFTSPTNILSGAPSPTRAPGKQCFSPSMQAPIKNHHSFTPSPSPSPTRKSFVRSLSPIIMRPSPLGKRKLEPDGDNRFEYMSPPKRFHTGPSTPDRLIPHPLAHSSVSSSSFEGSSPEQMVPRTASIHNIPSSNRPQPHMFGFMPLRETQDMQTTDSETSDVTESTDMSEPGDLSSSGMFLTTSDSPGTSSFAPVVSQAHL